ncbi:MAG: hypothetical protein PW999_21345 [Paraburkholderia tropica]|nr:hypothetical protein [Paraburkholderia tropica]
MSYASLSSYISENCSGFDSVYTITAPESTSSSVLDMAPTLDMKSKVEVADVVNTVGPYFFPLGILVVILIFCAILWWKDCCASICKCFTCGICSKKTKKPWKLTALVVQLFLLAIALAVFALSVVAAVETSKSALSERQCQLAELLDGFRSGFPVSFRSTSSSLNWIGLESMGSYLNAAGTGLGAISVSSSEATNLATAASYMGSTSSTFATRYGAAQKFWAMVVNNAATYAYLNTMDSTLASTVASVYQNVGYSYNATSFLYNAASFATASTPSTYQSVLTGASSVFQEAVSYTADFGDTLTSGTMDRFENSRMIIMMIFSIALAVFTALALIHYLVFVTFRGGYTKLAGKKGLTSMGFCTFKFFFFILMVIMLILSTLYMLFAYGFGSICNDLLPAAEPFTDFSNLFSDLQNDVVQNCFNYERKADFYITTGLYTPTTTLVTMYMGLSALSVMLSGSYTATPSTTLDSILTSVAALSSASCPSGAMMYDGTNTVSCATWIATIQTVAPAAFQESGTTLTPLTTANLAGASTELTTYMPVFNTPLAANAAAYSGRVCQASGLLLKGLLANVCMHEVVPMIIAANCWVALGCLAFILYYAYRRLHRHAKLDAPDDNNKYDAQVEEASAVAKA